MFIFTLMRNLLITLLLVGTCLHAQQTIVPEFDTITVVYGLWETPYLHEVSAKDTTQKNYNYSMAGTWLSFTGNVVEATRIMDTNAREMGMDTARFENLRDNYHPSPAVKSLLADAEHHEVVIINEAHHEPRHRVFTRQMLQGLYDRGYRHFGLETLSTFGSVDSLLKAGDYPGLNAGYYTRDPQFAAMIAEASRIGFSLFGYEAAGTGSPKLRELGQMRNIMAYRADHPEGKYLLHVGYSHANEGELGGRWEKAMAQRLADTTSLNPLTINQTHFREMSRPALERYEFKEFPVKEPSLFLNAEGEHWNFNNETRWFDRYVFHPRTTYQHGRPDYVFANGQVPVNIDCKQLKYDGPYLLQAYGPEDDMTKAVPRDVIETSKDKPQMLALLPGKYRLLVTVLDGKQFVTELVVL
jgi:hypothetical protein